MWLDDRFPPFISVDDELALPGLDGRRLIPVVDRRVSRR
jgi:hypothetical protein